MFSSQKAWMSAAVMESCPQPAQRVLMAPSYSRMVRSRAFLGSLLRRTLGLEIKLIYGFASRNLSGLDSSFRWNDGKGGFGQNQKPSQNVASEGRGACAARAYMDVCPGP